MTLCRQLFAIVLPEESSACAYVHVEISNIGAVPKLKTLL